MATPREFDINITLNEGALGWPAVPIIPHRSLPGRVRATNSVSIANILMQAALRQPIRNARGWSGS
jgi:hypothetical protein